MLFNSALFLLFFPSVTLLYFCLPRQLKNPCLLLASYFFYACWNPKYIILLFVTTFVTYAGGLLIERAGGGSSSGAAAACGSAVPPYRKKAVLFLVLLFNFGVLFLFKYYNWASGMLEWLLGRFHVRCSFPAFEPALPVGISFFTFQAVGYTIDVFRGELRAERHFFKYALFVSFFPQLVAGPIERSRTLLAQLDTTYTFDYERVRKGLLIMLWGFFLKVALADRAAVLVNQVYGNYMSYYGMQLILATLCFALQIYCDFMGYSTIARGAALVLGFRLTDNFAQPYFAPSVRDFWRRWHISLSSWFRDYVYIPLGGNRRSRLRVIVNLLVVWLLTGFWHGANWTFVAWGLLYFLALLLERVLGLAKKKNPLLRIWTLLVVMIAWALFRSSTLSDAARFIGFLFGSSGVLADRTSLVYLRNMGAVLPVACIVAFPVRARLERWFQAGSPSRRATGDILFSAGAVTILLASILACFKSSYNPFIYFNF